MRPAFWDFSKKIRSPNLVLGGLADPLRHLLEEIKHRFFFSSLTFEDTYNELVHICLSAWQSVFLFVCFTPLCEQCCAWD